MPSYLIIYKLFLFLIQEGNIGLHWSAFSGSVEISYLYLDYGCDINSVNELGDTPLYVFYINF